MAVRLPALATPNELLNYEYIAVMRQIRGLPNRGLVDSEIRYTEWHQPPVYFLLAALVGLAIPVELSPVNPPPPIEVEPNPAYLGTRRGNLNPAVHLTPATIPLLYTSRLGAALMGLVSLAVLYRVTSRLYTPGTGLLITSLLAFQPNFVHLSASVNNDMPLTAVTALIMSVTAWVVARDKGPLAFLGLGLLAGLALLTKANGAFVLAFVGAAGLVQLWQHRDWRRTLYSAILALVGAAVLWSPWLTLNTIRMKDTLGMQGSLPVGEVLGLNPLTFAVLRPYLYEIWRSFWLDWSAGQVGYGPDWVYGVAGGIVLVGLLGWVKRPSTPQPKFVPLVIFLGTLGICYLYFAVKALMVSSFGFIVPEGRWMLPAMPGLAWFAGVGFARWWPQAWRERVTTTMAVLLALFGVGLLVGLLPYLYPQAHLLPSADEAMQNVGIVYNDELALLGAALPQSLTVGELTELTLDWQAVTDIDADYSVSAQLLALAHDGWEPLEIQNSYPGSGLNPTKGWQAGEIYRDVLALQPEGELSGPTVAAAAVWLWQGGEMVAMTRAQQPLETPFVAETTIRPAHPLTPAGLLAEPVMFGDWVALVGVETAVTEAGLQLTLWWRAVQDVPADYTVFVHGVDENGQLVTQADGLPNGGYSPTRLWQTDDVVRDERLLVGAGNGRVLVGIYDPQTGVRLTAVQSGNPLPDNAYPLTINP
ncbi:MAG: glycosyltransferase family 39 protein [Ardenticatenaceae bacterium]|nr:glycosyltransferase family 39 protein [Ardenticatenaceae bacterium]